MNLTQLDLNQLVALDALLMEKSVSRAARKMFLTQSAMSRALSRLQETFDDSLLITVGGRRMVLTPLAEELVLPLREVLLKVREMTAIRPKFIPAVATKTITVCASDYAAITFLPRVMQIVTRDAPQVKIRVVQHDYTWADQLERGDVDLVIIPRQFALSQYPTAPLFTDTYCCIAAADHPDVGETFSLEQYLQESHVAVQFNFLLTSDIDQELQRLSGRVRSIGPTVPLFSLVPHAVVGTRLIGTLQSRLANLYAQFLPLKVLPLPFEFPVISEVVQHQRYQEADQGNVWFRRLMSDVAAELDAEIIVAGHDRRA